MRWSTEVAQVKVLPPGHAVGYGNTYVTTSHERVAMVPAGYSDGYRRGPKNAGQVLIHGRSCPIRGRVSMEKTVVSVQHLPGDVRIGDEVVLLGQVCRRPVSPCVAVAPLLWRLCVCVCDAVCTGRASLWFSVSGRPYVFVPACGCGATIVA
jgi:alanine racemase